MRIRRFFLLIISPLFLSLTPLYSDDAEQELEKWLQTGKAEKYLSAANDIRAIFNGPELEPPLDGILMEKLKEGASKGVPTGRLLGGLEQEKEKLVISLSLIEGGGYKRTDVDELYAPCKLVAIILREGFSEQVIEALFTAGTRQGMPVSASASAVSAVFQTGKITRLSDNDLTKLGDALFQSSLPPAMYESVVSIFVKGKGNRLSDSEILRLVETVFRRGGGLVQLERELNMRIRR